VISGHKEFMFSGLFGISIEEVLYLFFVARVAYITCTNDDVRILRNVQFAMFSMRIGKGKNILL
jgi:hypothetical protein